MCRDIVQHLEGGPHDVMVELGSFITISIYRNFVSLDGESIQFL